MLCKINVGTKIAYSECLLDDKNHLTTDFSNKKSPRKIVDFDLVGGPDGTNILSFLYFLILLDTCISKFYEILKSIIVHKKATKRSKCCTKCCTYFVS